MEVLGELEPEAIAHLHIKIHFNDWSGHIGGMLTDSSPASHATNPE